MELLGTPVNQDELTQRVNDLIADYNDRHPEEVEEEDVPAAEETEEEETVETEETEETSPAETASEETPPAETASEDDAEPGEEEDAREEE